MHRAHPVDMRKALEMVEAHKRAGILFVPMPVLNQEDHLAQIAEARRRLDLLQHEAEKHED